MLATDWSPDAVRATAANAALNEVEIETAQVAWSAPDAIVERAPWPYVIASDVLYEPRNVDTLLDLLPRLVDRKGRVLIADPGRRPGRGLPRARGRRAAGTCAARQPRSPRVRAPLRLR